MGGHGHGHKHEPPYVVPPYTQFQVKGLKQLEDLEKALAKKGLKDPWIRNEAWRYHPAFGTRASRAAKVFFRGMPYGAALAAVLAGAELIMNLAGGDEDHGGHH